MHSLPRSQHARRRASTLGVILTGAVALAGPLGCADDPTELGVDDAEIIGGLPANHARFDAVGALGTFSNNGWTPYCTASLISPTAAITAEHCAMGDIQGTSFLIGADGHHPKRAVRILGASVESTIAGGFLGLGSDVAMVLDECVAHPCTMRAAADAMQRTLGWARRARERMLGLRSSAFDDVTVTNPGQAQFGIVQGGVYPQLRQESASETVATGFEGYAIGGLSVGEPTDVMYDVVSQTTAALPQHQPRYLMGTGTPEDLVESVSRGNDLFDCVLPTRNARNGQLFTSGGRINIKNAQYAEDQRPPDQACACYTCRTCSRAYLRHLFLAGEIGAATLNTLHNLNFYLDTMRRIRDAIAFGRFESFRLAFHQRLSRQALDS